MAAGSRAAASSGGCHTLYLILLLPGPCVDYYFKGKIETREKPGKTIRCSNAAQRRRIYEPSLKFRVVGRFEKVTHLQYQCLEISLAKRGSPGLRRFCGAGAIAGSWAMLIAQ